MDSPNAERTGAAIRKLRLAKGWTLAQLSAASGLPLSTLSRVELGGGGLNTEKLVRLCRALDIDLTGLVAQEASAQAPVGRRAVTRAGEGESLPFGPHQAHAAASELLNKPFSPMVLDITVRDLAAHGPLRTLPGEAYVLVMEGRVQLESSAYAPLALGAGDAVFFDGRSGYALLAPDGAARVLLVIAGHSQI